MSRRSKGDMAADVLVNAREILSESSRCARVATAINSAGKWVDLRSPSAVAWCPYGAILLGIPHVKDADYRCRGAARMFLDRAVAQLFQQTLIGWWDRSPSTHAQLMEVFDVAIADAKGAA